MTETTYRAWATPGAGEPLAETTLTAGALPADEVEVRVTHCGICHSDVHLIDDNWQVGVYPLVPGHEAVGEIVALGSGVHGLQIGQRVGVGWQRGACGHCDNCRAADEQMCSTQQATAIGMRGGFAERLRVQAPFALPLPDALSSVDAGPLLCGGITVYAPLARWARPGARVGVIGIGGLGHLAIRFAAAMGCEVTAFTSSPDKAEQARAFGARHIAPSRDAEALGELKETLDVIVSTVHAPLDWAAFISTLRANGTFVFVGVPPEPLTLPVGLLLGRQRRVSGSMIGNLRDLHAMLDFAAQHGVQAQTETFAIDDVNAAVDHVRQGKARYRAVLRF